MPQRQATERKYSAVGGAIGSLLGILVLGVSVICWQGLIGTKNPLLMIVAIIWGLVNLIGIVGFPLLGFAIGYGHFFTVTRTTFHDE